MKTLRLVLAGTSLAMVLAAPAQAFDLKGMTDSANKAVNDASEKASSGIDEASGAANSAMDSANQGLAVTGEAQTLVDSLTKDLGVTSQQAAGGAGALLAMAQNNLPADQFGGVLDKVPGLDSLLGGGGMASSMLGNISSLQGVGKAFSALGLSPDMISQFAPKILEFLGGQGVGGQVLGSLKGLWGV
ncbi:MAG: DUF2780 domain-containing protein [Pseudomonadales bacterium]|nr:DUF2780 domain-containing protein [Pseudomonadales bacterium]